ncbi:MAG: ribonuclease III [Pseudomonadota bacterium]
MSEVAARALEERLGYRFKDAALLLRALTHASLSGVGADVRNLERLEFLGDRVLGLLTAEELWRRYPDQDEGYMAPRLNALVRKETCAKAALYFKLDDAIRMSSWEEGAGGRKKKAILGDAMEALLGALYIDGGLDAARGVYNQYWTPNLEALSKFHRDPKTALQEWTQRKRLGTPDYDVLDADGPDHAPAFTVKVSVKKHQSAVGEGRSKRAAQMDAARAFLVREKVWQDE